MSDPGYKITEEKNQNGVVTKITRDIKENGHPVFSQDNVMKYVQARIEAAIALNDADTQKTKAQKAKDNWELRELGKNLPNFFNSAESQQFKAAFENAKETYTLSATPLAEKAYHAAFDVYYQYNMAKIQQVSVLLAHYVEPNNKKPAAVIKKINTKANHLRAKQIRPIQENHYEVSGDKIMSSHIPAGALTQSQQNLYQEIYQETAPSDRLYTNPSTIRDSFQVGQANALWTEIKVNNKLTFKGYRHGSPCVLKIENEAERQYRTMQNVRQTMALAAKEKLDELKEEKKLLENKKEALKDPEKNRLEKLTNILDGKVPLPLDIATMSLLSPVADDNPLLTKKLDDPMKQYRQVNDSREAYWSLHGREVVLDMPGEKPIRVVLNSTFMSVGVNAARGIGTLEAQALVQRVNNRGLSNFVSNFVKKLKPEDNPLKNNELIAQIRKIEDNASIEKYNNKINTYNKSKLKIAYRNLETTNSLLHVHFTKLKGLKTTLASCESASEKKALKSEISQLKVAIHQVNFSRKKVKNIIKKEELKLDVYYKKLAQVRKREYLKELPALQTMLTNKQENKTPDELKSDKNLQKLILFVDLLDTFYNQPQPGLKRLRQQKKLSKEKNKILKSMEQETNPIKIEKFSEKAEQWQEKIDGLNKGNYQFQARFALLAQHMDNFVEWFCKSGEDRTGLLNEHIEAYCIFIEQNGHAPRWGNEEDNKKFHKMMPHVHNGAPNRETNGFNDDSPGLKVSDADFEMRNLSYYTDKKMANMAADSSKIKGVMNVEKIKKIIKGEPENVNPPIVSTFNHNKLLTQVNKTQQPTPDNPSTPKKLKPKS